MKHILMRTAALTTSLLVGLAVTAVAQSESSPPPTAGPAAESLPPALDSGTELAPPVAEGLEWDDVSIRLGDEIAAETDEAIQAQWDALLEGTAATYEQASQLNARALDPESGETIGQYSAIRITDADEARLREAMLGVFRAGAAEEGFEFEEADIGGKVVTVITRDADEQAIVYVSGDTAHLMDMPTEQLESVLAALP